MQPLQITAHQLLLIAILLPELNSQSVLRSVAPLLAKLSQNFHRKSLKIIDTSTDLGDHSSAIVTYHDFSITSKLPNSRKSSSTWKHWKLRGMREQLRSWKLRFQRFQRCQRTRHLPILYGRAATVTMPSSMKRGCLETGWAWWKSRQGRASQSEAAC